MDPYVSKARSLTIGVSLPIPQMAKLEARTAPQLPSDWKVKIARKHFLSKVWKFQIRAEPLTTQDCCCKPPWSPPPCDQKPARKHCKSDPCRNPACQKPNSWLLAQLCHYAHWFLVWVEWEDSWKSWHKLKWHGCRKCQQTQNLAKNHQQRTVQAERTTCKLVRIWET
jgi:hypothetical protein